MRTSRGGRERGDAMMLAEVDEKKEAYDGYCGVQGQGLDSVQAQEVVELVEGAVRVKYVVHCEHLKKDC